MREKVSKHFYRDEFECKCGCGFDVVDIMLNKVLEDIREHFGTPIAVNSASRCSNHNMAVGGRLSSQHLLGKAADIAVDKVTPLRIYQYLDVKYGDVFGIGHYDTFTHIDVRERKARWGTI